MRVWATLALLVGIVSSGFAQGKAKALIVGIDRYERLTGEEPAAIKLSGAANDIRLIDRLLGAMGFATEVLAQENATRAAMENWLRSNAASAAKDDEFVFYFSGRGSVAPSKEPEGPLVPSLVPFDAQKATGKDDLAITALESFAAEVRKKGGRVTFVLDTCFFPPPALKSLEGRPWKTAAKCFRRGGVDASRMRKALYEGPGVMLAATSPLGAAYETRQSNAADSWGGAFTEFLFGQAMARYLQGAPLTARDLLCDAAAYFSALSGQAYLRDQRPVAPRLAADPDYDLPVFRRTPKAVSPEMKPLADAVKAEREESLRAMRLAIDFATEDRAEREAMQKAATDLSAALAKTEGLSIAPYGKAPDRVLYVESVHPLRVRLGASEVAKDERNRFEGNSVEDLVSKGGLVQRLGSQWLAMRLFRLLEDHRGELAGKWMPESSKVTYRQEDDIFLRFTAPVDGALICLNRDDADGLIDLWFPHIYASENRFPAGQAVAPAIPYGFSDETKPGRSVMFALFVEDEKSSLPVLPPSLKEALDESEESKRLSDAFERARIEFLTRVVEIVEREPRKFAAKRIVYEFVREAAN